MATIEKLYTVEQIAEHLMMNASVVRRWLQEGKIKGIKLGHKGWRIRESELLRLVNQGISDDNNS